MARDAARTRRRGGARLGDPATPERLGGLRPSRWLHRSARGLPRLRPALPRRPPGRARVPTQALRAPRRVQGLRPHGGARVQPHVRDHDRAGEGLRLGRLPAPRDRAGDLHQLQERAAVLPQEAAVRDRPGREVVSQRDHARQLHLPHARVRADGDGVLRAPRRSRRAGTSTGSASARAGTSSSVCAPTTCACAPTAPTSSRTTPRRRATSSTSSHPPGSAPSAGTARRTAPRAGRTAPRATGGSSRGSPIAATSTSPSTRATPARSSSTSTRGAASATCRT